MARESTARADEARNRASWADNPQQRPLRRWLLKVHLWTAMFLGAYVVLISVTGSAVVMRPQLGRWMAPPRFIQPADVKLSETELTAIIQQLYDGHAITSLSILDNPMLPASVVLERTGTRLERRFDPYTGEDLGDPFPWPLQAMEWLVDLHDNLLSGRTGRKLNGVGASLFLLVVATGVVLWWPGRDRWLNSMTISWRARGYRFYWRLHSFLGFWSLSLLVIWALTGLYFAFPGPYEDLIDLLDRNPEDFERPGEATLLFLIDGHFGRFRNLYLQALWMLLGLIPALLFISGFIIWWKKRPKRLPDRTGESH